MVRLFRTLGALAALAASLCACSGTAGQSFAPSAYPGGATQAIHFRPATAAERAARARVLSAGKRIAGKDAFGNPGYYTLIDWLTSDDNLNFSTAGKVCDSSLQDATLYVALTDFTLPVPQTELPPCVQNGTVATGNLYIVRVEVGLLYLSVEPLSGQANASTGYWIFTPLEKSADFSAYSVYTFFVASWSGSGTPPTINI
jgi:hypothetical protein